MLFNSFVISTANCSPLSDTILSGNLCSLHTLSLNNLANPSADVPSIVATKCVIFDNLLQTTKITSFLVNNSSSFSMYTFPSFNTNSSSICYSFPHNIFTPTFFISSTTLTTSLSLLLTFFIFSTISTSGSSITTSCKLQS